MPSFYFLLKSKGRDAAMAEQPLISAHTHNKPPLFPKPSSGKSPAFPFPSQNYSGFHTWHLLFFSSSALLTFPNPAPAQGDSDPFPGGALACLHVLLTSRPFCLGEMFGWGLSLLQDSPSQFHPQRQAAGISWPGSFSGCPPSSWPPQRRSNICPCAAASQGDTAHTLSLWVDRGNI